MMKPNYHILLSERSAISDEAMNQATGDMKLSLKYLCHLDKLYWENIQAKKISPPDES